MVGWHHQLNGHEFEQVPGDGEGQESLACCSPRGRKESDMTERLNNKAEAGRGRGREVLSAVRMCRAGSPEMRAPEGVCPGGPSLATGTRLLWLRNK